jgi:hypothetical protein
MSALASRPIDLHLSSENAALDAKLFEVTKLVQLKAEANKKPAATRRIGEKREAQLHQCVKCLVLNLYCAWKADPLSTVGISLRNNSYSARADLPPHISYRYLVKKAFGGLIEEELVQVVKEGFFDKSKGEGETTRIRATERLIRLIESEGEVWPWEIGRPTAPLLVLRDAAKKPLPIADSDDVQNMRLRLQRINAMLNHHWADLDISDGDFERLATRLAADDNKTILDLSRRTVTRIFNNGSLDQGGRFYGAWWMNVPSEYRSKITLDGKPAVEVDFSGMHGRMIYHLEGLEPPDDPYDLGKGEYARGQAKKAFNALLNSGPRQIRQFDDYDATLTGYSWKQFLKALEQKNAPVTRYFRTGIGLQLQRRDSDIAERVLLHFAEIGAACLPVHDSFLVHHGYLDDLKREMASAYAFVVGKEAKFKDNWTEVFPPNGSVVPVSNDLDDNLSCLDKSSIFERRREAWFARRSTTRT